MQVNLKKLSPSDETSGKGHALWFNMKHEALPEAPAGISEPKTETSITHTLSNKSD